MSSATHRTARNDLSGDTGVRETSSHVQSIHVENINSDISSTKVSNRGKFVGVLLMCVVAAFVFLKQPAGVKQTLVAIDTLRADIDILNYAPIESATSASLSHDITNDLGNGESRALKSIRLEKGLDKVEGHKLDAKLSKIFTPKDDSPSLNIRKTQKRWVKMAREAAPRPDENGDLACSANYLRLVGEPVGEASNHIFTLANGLAVADSLSQLLHPKQENGVTYRTDSDFKFEQAFHKRLPKSLPNTRYTLLVPAYIMRDLTHFTLKTLQKYYCVKFLEDGTRDDKAAVEFLQRHKKNKEKYLSKNNLDSSTTASSVSFGPHLSETVKHKWATQIKNPPVKEGDMFITAHNLFYWGTETNNWQENHTQIKQAIRDINDNQSHSFRGSGRRNLAGKPRRKRKGGKKKGSDDDGREESDDAVAVARAKGLKAPKRINFKMDRSDDSFEDDDRSMNYWQEGTLPGTDGVHYGSDFLFQVDRSGEPQAVTLISGGKVKLVDGVARTGKNKNKPVDIVNPGFFARYMLGTIAALWSDMSPDLSTLAAFLSRTYFRGTFNYNAVHKRQFEGNCNKIMREKSSLKRDFALLTSVVPETQRQAWQNGKIEHPVCTMDAPWVRSLGRRKSSFLHFYVASDGQADISDWRALSVASAKPKDSKIAVIGRDVLQSLERVGRINGNIVDLLMAALADGVFVGNPMSTFSMQVSILRMISGGEHMDAPFMFDFDYYQNIYVRPGWKMKQANSKKKAAMDEYGGIKRPTWVTRRILGRVIQDVTGKITKA